MKVVNRPWLAASALALLSLSPLLAAPDLFTEIYTRGMVKQRTMKSLARGSPKPPRRACW
jgi:hypothetical protein